MFFCFSISVSLIHILVCFARFTFCDVNTKNVLEVIMRIFHFISILFLLSNTVNLVFADPNPVKVSSSPLEFGKNLTFESIILNKSLSMNVYLPESFEASSDENRYPVIFANGSHGAEFFHTLTGVVKHLGELDRMPESIVVSLNKLMFKLYFVVGLLSPKIEISLNDKVFK